MFKFSLITLFVVLVRSTRAFVVAPSTASRPAGSSYARPLSSASTPTSTTRNSVFEAFETIKGGNNFIMNEISGYEQKPKQRCFYAILGIPRNAKESAIRRAYRTLAKQHHPDANSNPNCEKFQEINQAYHVLITPELKREYDKYGIEGKPIFKEVNPGTFQFDWYNPDAVREELEAEARRGFYAPEDGYEPHQLVLLLDEDPKNTCLQEHPYVTTGPFRIVAVHGNEYITIERRPDVLERYSIRQVRPYNRAFQSPLHP